MHPMTPTEDIRAARHRLAAKFENDLERIVADLRRQQAESDAEFVTLPSRPPSRTTNTVVQSGASGRVPGSESTRAAS